MFYLDRVLLQYKQSYAHSYITILESNMALGNETLLWRVDVRILIHTLPSFDDANEDNNNNNNN